MRSAAERMVKAVKAGKRLCKLLRSRDGSSLISVLVAFIILLIGIAGFSRAVQTANDMVRRAEQLNTATGKVLCGDGTSSFEGFYASYAAGKILPLNYRGTPVYKTDKDGNVIGSGEAFQIHCQLRTRAYKVTVPDTKSGDPVEIDYSMHFYK